MAPGTTRHLGVAAYTEDYKVGWALAEVMVCSMDVDSDSVYTTCSNNKISRGKNRSVQ
jgi:hypothetical protein